jgi:RNA polymerase sigma factor (sigma-70 family)
MAIHSRWRVQQQLAREVIFSGKVNCTTGERTITVQQVAALRVCRMAASPLGMFLSYLRQQVYSQHADGDNVLLERFVQQQQEDAFATLLGRYGPLVLRVCRHILSQEPDVEDAFQATFLVLAHKAGSLHPGKPLAPWLYGVACRVAMAARRCQARRRFYEQQGASMHAEDHLENSEDKDLQAMLHEEVDRLPAKYRQPLVLCYFDGQTHDQAAARLAWPVGTVRTRLSRGRDLLHRRLVRRGVTLSTGAFLGVFAQTGASAAVPVDLSETTLKAVMLVAAGETAKAGVSAGVHSLVQGVLRTMFLSKVKSLVVLLLLVVGLTVGGTGIGFAIFNSPLVVAQPGVNPDEAKTPSLPKEKKADGKEQADYAERFKEASVVLRVKRFPGQTVQSFDKGQLVLVGHHAAIVQVLKNEGPDKELGKASRKDAYIYFEFCDAGLPAEECTVFLVPKVNEVGPCDYTFIGDRTSARGVSHPKLAR